MKKCQIYPQINLGSKNEIAKRISNKKLTQKQALELINNVIINFDKFWYDSAISKPGKYVRSAVNTPLGKLLNLIDKKILAPYDNLVPEFIFGGISKKNNVIAAYYLLGNKRKGKTKLSLDIKTFYEQNTYERVMYFFYSKADCSLKAAKLLANLTCVPEGPKNMGNKNKILARGFATSSRLALWSNLELFLRVYWLTKKRLKGHSPRIAIFVDDIGIFANNVSKLVIEKLADEIEILLKNHDPNHALPLHPKGSKKWQIQNYIDGPLEHLGLRLGKRGLSLAEKTAKKEKFIRSRLGQKISDKEKISLIKRKKSYIIYKQYIKKIEKN